MIDVIIPLYNSKATISNTLDSILKQVNLKDIIVYLVDDQSTEKYEDIINYYSNYINIRYLKLKKNSGPGVARQYGIDNSHNEYIVFIDSDDEFCSQDSLLVLYNSIHGYDMVFSRMIQCFENSEETVFHECCLHGKMYRRSFIEDKKLKFNKLRSHEDNAFNQLYMICSKNINYISNVTYKYNFNYSSITRTANGKDSLKKYISSMTWLYKNVEKQKYVDIFYAGIVITEIMYYSYFNLMVNNINTKIIKEKLYYLKKMYDKYGKYVSVKEKINMFNGFYNQVIPQYTFYDFLKMYSK